MTARARHDATLDDALDRCAVPRLRAGIAFALALLIALLLAAYGLRAWNHRSGAEPQYAEPLPSARPASGN
jgi:hypothetical protein